MQKYIEFDREKYERLRKEYDKAVNAGAEVFTFEENEILVSYARYLLEFLQLRFRKEESKMGFGEWMRKVDAEMMNIAGVTHKDIADHLYRDAYDSGEEPEDVARDALLDDGFPPEALPEDE